VPRRQRGFSRLWCRPASSRTRPGSPPSSRGPQLGPGPGSCRAGGVACKPAAQSYGGYPVPAGTRGAARPCRTLSAVSDTRPACRAHPVLFSRAYHVTLRGYDRSRSRHAMDDTMDGFARYISQRHQRWIGAHGHGVALAPCLTHRRPPVFRHLRAAVRCRSVQVSVSARGWRSRPGWPSGQPSQLLPRRSRSVALSPGPSSAAARHSRQVLPPRL
jgi:hypothetical protein